MDISNEQLKQIRRHRGLKNNGSPDFGNMDLTLALLKQYESGGFLCAYSFDSSITINNLLRGEACALSLENKITDPKIYARRLRNDLDDIEHRQLWVNQHVYLPMPLYLTKQIIEVDEMFRASKAWNQEPITIYRGTVPEFTTNYLNSTSLLEEQAVRFYKGNLLTTTLPEHFPYIRMYRIVPTYSVFVKEQEILLPPCDYEIVSTKVKKQQFDYREDKKIINVTEIKLTPKSLAKELLRAMKNPPKDYPREYIEDPRFEWQQSLEVLEDYVSRFVDNNVIQVNTQVLHEYNPKRLTQK